MRHPIDFTAILECLARHQVELVVIGGTAAALQGAPVVTYDLDIVHRRTEANVARLVAALGEIDAYYREHPDWRPTPDVKLLMGRGHHLLLTTRGAVDVLGVVTEGRDYEALAPHAEMIELSDELQVPVLSLEMLVTLKSELARDKDKMVLPILRATLEERRRAEGPKTEIGEGES
jgi:hypothetical protein